MSASGEPYVFISLLDYFITVFYFVFRFDFSNIDPCFFSPVYPFPAGFVDISPDFFCRAVEVDQVIQMGLVLVSQGVQRGFRVFSVPQVADLSVNCSFVQKLLIIIEQLLKGFEPFFAFNKKRAAVDY